MILAAISSLVLVTTLETVGTWALAAPVAGALAAAAGARRLGVCRNHVFTCAAITGIGALVLFPVAFVTVGVAVLAAYAAVGFVCILLDLAGAPTDWCPLG